MLDVLVKRLVESILNAVFDENLSFEIDGLSASAWDKFVSGFADQISPQHLGSCSAEIQYAFFRYYRRFLDTHGHEKIARFYPVLHSSLSSEHSGVYKEALQIMTLVMELDTRFCNEIFDRHARSFNDNFDSGQYGLPYVPVLVLFWKAQPRQFLNTMNEIVSRSLWDHSVVLHLLIRVLSANSPHIAEIAPSALFNLVMTKLQGEKDKYVLSVCLLAMDMMIPYSTRTLASFSKILVEIVKTLIGRVAETTSEAPVDHSLKYFLSIFVRAMYWLFPAAIRPVLISMEDPKYRRTVREMFIPPIDAYRTISQLVPSKEDRESNTLEKDAPVGQKLMDDIMYVSDSVSQEKSRWRDLFVTTLLTPSAGPSASVSAHCSPYPSPPPSPRLYSMATGTSTMAQNFTLGENGAAVGITPSHAKVPVESVASFESDDGDRAVASANVGELRAVYDRLVTELKQDEQPSMKYNAFKEDVTAAPVYKQLMELEWLLENTIHTAPEKATRMSKQTTMEIQLQLEQNKLLYEKYLSNYFRQRLKQLQAMLMNHSVSDKAKLVSWLAAEREKVDDLNEKVRRRTEELEEERINWQEWQKSQSDFNEKMMEDIEELRHEKEFLQRQFESVSLSDRKLKAEVHRMSLKIAFLEDQNTDLLDAVDGYLGGDRVGGETVSGVVSPAMVGSGVPTSAHPLSAPCSPKSLRINVPRLAAPPRGASSCSSMTAKMDRWLLSLPDGKMREDELLHENAVQRSMINRLETLLRLEQKEKRELEAQRAAFAFVGGLETLADERSPPAEKNISSK